MSKETFAKWDIWSNEKLVSELPRLISQVEPYLGVLPREHEERNRSTITSLQAALPSVGEISTGRRNSEFFAFGFVLDKIGRKLIKDGDTLNGMRLLHAAYEVFRIGNPDSQPNKPMRLILNAACQTLINERIELMKRGEMNIESVREELLDFVKAFFSGSIPSDLILSLNERLLLELESVRTENENDQAFHRRLVRDNIETVLALEIPTRLATIQDKWKEIGDHVAPDAVRLARQTLKLPEKLSDLLSQQVWANLEKAVEQGDISGLRQCLSGVEEQLESNLRLRLTAKTEYRMPVSEIRFGQDRDRFFQEAYDLLKRGDSRSVEKFRDIHFRRPNHWAAKEWYAYSLAIFGRATDVHEIITLLEETIALPSYRMEFGWVARWNLACALRRLPSREDEALDKVVPLLEADFHMLEVFELCLLWALDQDCQDLLPSLLLRSPYHEAHLLAALYDTQSLSLANPTAFNFLRVNRVLRNPNHIFPSPEETLSEIELDGLIRDFIDSSLIEAGIEWFRQRLFFEGGRGYYKNWECAARLNEELEDWNAAWRCRQQQWACTRRSRLSPEGKARSLTNLLSWVQRHRTYSEEALRILRQNWRNTSLQEADVRLWEQRLGSTRSGTAPLSSQPIPLGSSKSLPPQPDSAPTLITEEIEDVIQATAGTFQRISTVEALATKEAEALRLIEAVSRKYPEIMAGIGPVLREMIRLAVLFARGVDEAQGQELAQEIKDQMELLRQHRTPALPYALVGLTDACERAAQNITVRVRVIPNLSITPPADLGVRFDVPASGETYFTRVFVRLSNSTSEKVTAITASLSSPSSFLRVVTPEVILPQLALDEKFVFEFPVEVSHGIEAAVDVRLNFTCEIGGIKRNLLAGGRIPVVPNGPDIPVSQRYLTNAPVGAERTDLFHGRDRELKELAAAFVGGQLRKLYFVNGIRRVGKSSLMHHLGRRYESEVLPLLLNVETVLSGQKMTSVQFVRQLVREAIKVAQAIPGLPPLALQVPEAKEFDMDPPWVVFDLFIEELSRQAQRKNVLLCLDEVQRLVMRIADSDDPMDEGFLTWLRGKIQTQSSTLIVCTGSEPYEMMRERYKHNLWGNMEPYNVSFVDKMALRRIATTPVEPDGVTWLPEALDELWDMTEGHPWVIQVIAEKVTGRLNIERRRLVGSSDIEWAARAIASDDPRISELWWNEEDGLVIKTHRDIAFLILQRQAGPRQGLTEPELIEACQLAGIKNIVKHLMDMKALEVLTSENRAGQQIWRIRGAFLEGYLAVRMQREQQTYSTKTSAYNKDQSLALMLDWENVKISLTKFLDERPREQAEALRPRLATDELAQRLFKLAARYGNPLQRWAVANWDKAFFDGDQASLKRTIRYETDMSGDEKSNASDHVLRERIHAVLRDHPEVSAYVIGTGDGDFVEMMRTLQDKEKLVILWSTRGAFNNDYRYLLSHAANPIRIEWLEDLIFGEEAEAR